MTPGPTPELRSRVRRCITDHGLIQPGDRVLAAVSGGPDSTCLLLTLAALRRSLKFELVASHFDHRLRGRRAAASEERFVRLLTNDLDVPLRVGDADVRTHAKTHRQSIEEAARELRYQFLARIAHEAECGIVAAGHTRDDQAETVLLHLVRGSGLRGLAAMATSSPWPVAGAHPPRLVRPLLELSRKETAGCCRAAGLTPVEDLSNRAPAQTRSRIRHQLLPLLREFNPRIDDALARLAENAAADVDFLEQLASQALRGPGKDGEVRLRRRNLASLPAALQRHAVRLAIARARGDARNVGSRHLQAVLRANAGPTGAELDLPRGLRVEVQRASIVFGTSPRPADTVLPRREVALPTPGTARFGPWQFEAELLERRPRSAKLAAAGIAVLDADACGTNLKLRRRQTGDRFRPLGMLGEKKLQDFFVDAHVPRGDRDALPLLCANRGIVWVVTQRPAEWAKFTSETRRFLLVRATRLPT